MSECPELTSYQKEQLDVIASKLKEWQDSLIKRRDALLVAYDPEFSIKMARLACEEMHMNNWHLREVSKALGWLRR